MPTDDRVTECLANFHLRAENVQNCPPNAPDALWRSIHGRAAEALAPAVAAVEAVLALAGKLEPQASPSSALEEDRMWIRQQCADMIREAITSALLPEETPDATVPEPAPAGLAAEVTADQAGPGGSMNPTPDCGGERKPPGATELWWCDAHREFHGTPPAEEDGNG